MIQGIYLDMVRLGHAYRKKRPLTDKAVVSDEQVVLRVCRHLRIATSVCNASQLPSSVRFL